MDDKKLTKPISILVRNLDQEVVQVLRERAESNGRSLNSEMVMVLQDATRKMPMKEWIEEVERMQKEMDFPIFPAGTAAQWVREDRDSH